MAFKLGLKAPRPGAVKLRLATYLDFRKLPKIPSGDFGHTSLISDWGMLGNDEWGDCALAGACHQTMLWTTEGGHPATFSTDTALKNYAAVTGFNINAGPSGFNDTDQGTDIGQLANHWLKVGIIDDAGNYHKVVAVADLNPGDLRELWIATYLFQSVGMGFALPESAEEQTARGEAWDVVPGAEIVGGHYVPCVARSSGLGVGVTWAKTQPFTPAFYREFNDQGIVALSEEMLVNAKSVDGFDDALLRYDISML